MKCLITGCDRPAILLKYNGMRIMICDQCRIALYFGMKIGCEVMTKSYTKALDNELETIKMICNEEIYKEEKE